MFDTQPTKYFISEKKKKLFNSKWRRFHNSQKIWLALRLLKPNLMNKACNKCIFVTWLKLLPTYLTTDVKPHQTAEIGQKMQFCHILKTERFRDSCSQNSDANIKTWQSVKLSQSYVLSYQFGLSWYRIHPFWRFLSNSVENQFFIKNTAPSHADFPTIAEA